MLNKLFFIDNRCTNPYFNLALEEYLLKNISDKNFMLLWQNDNTIVIGINQNAAEEINFDYVKENNITVVRRTTGGGAVYHDLGNINFSFITNLDEESGFTINDFVQPIIRALASMGITASADGRNDITVNGRKISGNAQRLYKNRILHHGTLLFDSNVKKISSSLKVKPEKFTSKSTKSVESRVANISDYLPKGTTINDFREMLLKSIHTESDIEEYKLSDEEIREVTELSKKYAEPAWTFRNAQPMKIHASRHFDGGIIEINMNVEKDKITECKVFGDFMAVKDISELEKALENTEFSPAAIKEKLSTLPLNELLGEITADEFINCIFG